MRCSTTSFRRRSTLFLLYTTIMPTHFCMHKLSLEKTESRCLLYLYLTFFSSNHGYKQSLCEDIKLLEGQKKQLLDGLWQKHDWFFPIAQTDNKAINHGCMQWVQMDLIQLTWRSISVTCLASRTYSHISRHSPVSVLTNSRTLKYDKHNEIKALTLVTDVHSTWNNKSDKS